MREWNVAPEAFAAWRGFACLLDSELRQMDRFVGNAYRAVNFRVPAGLYQKGGVVTWNQPSSASSNPKVAKAFLQGGAGGALQGTIFILRSAAARGISAHSVYPHEAEVLFPAGTQFQVLSQADAGLKGLLEAAMRCTLQQVWPLRPDVRRLPAAASRAHLCGLMWPGIHCGRQLPFHHQPPRAHRQHPLSPALVDQLAINR